MCVYVFYIHEKQKTIIEADRDDLRTLTLRATRYVLLSRKTYRLIRYKLIIIDENSERKRVLSCTVAKCEIILLKCR